MIVIVTAVLSFLYSVVFNAERNIQFISTVSLLIAVVSYLIMLIVVILLAKTMSVFVILFIAFYSFLFLLFAEKFNFVSKIIEMMSDTTEQCLDNSSQSTFSKIMNVFYRYSFFLLVFIVIFVRIVHALHDIRTITEKRVRVSCYAIYITLLVLFLLLMGYNFMDVFMHVKKIITGEKTTANGKPDEEDEFDTDEPDDSIFGKIAKAIRSFGENIGLMILIFIESLKYIGIQFAGFLYKLSATLASKLNPFGKTETTPSTPSPPTTAPVNITAESTSQNP
jgi:hypothetical protein